MRAVVARSATVWGLAGWALTASWQLDVWGRVRPARDSATLQLAATQSDLDAARLSVAAAVTRAWLTAIEARLRERLARATVGTYDNRRARLRRGPSILERRCR